MLSQGVEAGAAIFTVTVMGFKLVQGELKAIDEKKHAKELAKIGEISTEAFAATPHLEPIFNRVKPDDEKSPLKGPVLTPATLKSIAKCQASFDNKALDRYVRHVQNAVSYLYEYHCARLARSHPYTAQFDDATSSVICYLIIKLGQECVKFVDNQKALATLEALATFVKKFASARDKNTKQTFRFVRLTQVYDELNISIFLLKDHMLSLSLTERVKEFLSVCDEAAQSLLICSIKMIVPNDHWHLLDSFNPERLQLGILRHKYVYWEGWPVKFKVTQDAVKMPDSLMTNWIIMNTKDYLLSLALEDDKDNKCDTVGPQRFVMPEKLDYEHIAKIYAHSRNFMTMTVAPVADTTATSHFVTITQPELMRARVEFELQLEILTHYLIDGCRFGALLRNRLIEFGERYARLPEDTVYMYSTVDEFRNQLMSHTQNVMTKVSEMLTDQHKAMLNEAEDDGLYNEVKAKLTFIQQRLNQAITQLIGGHNDRLNHKHKHLDVIHNTAVKAVDDDVMIKFCRLLVERYGLVIKQPIVVVAENPQVVHNATLKMFKTLGQIQLRLTEIENTEQDPAINSYNKMYTFLLALLYHTREIYNDRTASRRDKAAHMQLLLASYNQDFLTFIKQSLPRRYATVKTFTDNLDESLRNPFNNFLDSHKEGTFKLFTTKARHITNEFKRESVTLESRIARAVAAN